MSWALNATGHHPDEASELGFLQRLRDFLRGEKTVDVTNADGSTTPADAIHTARLDGVWSGSANLLDAPAETVGTGGVSDDELAALRQRVADAEAAKAARDAEPSAKENADAAAALVDEQAKRDAEAEQLRAQLAALDQRPASDATPTA